ncbi:hypothetical protein GCM10009624_13620 [Gordonia sinesedis]
MSGRRSTIPVRGYALTRWSRGFVDAVEGRGGAATATGDPRADSRRIIQARSYFRDRKTRRLTVRPGSVTAQVWGSQLDPFAVTLSVPVIDPTAVADTLRRRDAVGEMMALTRGEQPGVLGELLVPAGPGDVVAECDCPDTADRCIHVLTVAYEIAAEIDRSATTLLTLRGSTASDLLGALNELADPAAATDRRAARDDEGAADGSAARQGDGGGGTAGRGAMPTVDFYGVGAPAPPLPTPPAMNPLTDLDAGALRTALRASGVSPADLADALDELGDLYDRLTPAIS